jgi:hypothetical protein
MTDAFGPRRREEPVAVPDRDETLLRFEVREVNLLVLRLVVLAMVLAVTAPLLWAIWPT